MSPGCPTGTIDVARVPAYTMYHTALHTHLIHGVLVCVVHSHYDVYIHQVCNTSTTSRYVIYIIYIYVVCRKYDTHSKLKYYQWCIYANNDVMEDGRLPTVKIVLFAVFRR